MLKVYHGSTLCVSNPLAGACRDNLDFGKGFYVTDLKEQAETWAKRVAMVKNCEEAYLNVYNLDIETIRLEYRVLSFSSYDNDWLDFVISSRRGECPWKGYDMVEGGVANDRVFNTIELYYTGLIPKEEALRRLRFEKLANNDNDIKVGEQVVTSYVSDRFVQGLFIGYISEINVDSNNLTRSGYITPAVDFSKIQEVLVLTKTKEDMTNGADDESASDTAKGE